MNLDGHKKTVKRDIPLLPAFGLFVFSALLSRDWGLCSAGGAGGGGKGKGRVLQIRHSSSGSEAVLPLTTRRLRVSKILAQTAHL